MSCVVIYFRYNFVGYFCGMLCFMDCSQIYLKNTLNSDCAPGVFGQITIN